MKSSKAATAQGLTERQMLDQRLSAFRSDQSSWRPHWQEISDNVLPRRTRFQKSEVNKGTQQNGRIYNNTATRGVRTLSSGIMASVTSPSRPWFKLGVLDEELAEDRDVVDWLADCEDQLRAVLSRSNYYNCLSDGVYEDLVAYGTSAMLLEEDEQDVLACYPKLIGTYYLGVNARGQVDSYYEEAQFTVAQMISEFPWEKLSQNVQMAQREGRFDQLVDVVHVIEPNALRDPSRADARGMKFKSTWYEVGADRPDILLKVSGYREFPVLAPRWSVRPGDAYGRSPVMDCLGDIKALQRGELRKAEATDKVLRPPMVGPSSMQQAGVSLIPSAINWMPSGSLGKLEPAVQVPPITVEIAGADIREIQARIDATLFSDLWLMLASDDRAQRQTAEEVRAKKEERLLQLGPVLERLTRELFEPTIERVFAIAERAELLPPRPPIMRAQARRKKRFGQRLDVQFTSILHQSLKVAGIASIERTVAFAGNVAGMGEEGARALEKLNLDKIVIAHADAAGLDPDLLRTEREVAEYRKLKAQQAVAMQQALAQAEAQAKAQAEAGPPGEGAPQQAAPLGPAPELVLPPQAVEPAGALVASQADRRGDANINRLLSALGPPAVNPGGFPPSRQVLS